MRRNRLFVFLSMLACLFTSCGGSTKYSDPVITFDGLGGTLVTGEITTSVKSGTLWSDISKPIYSKDDSVSLFYTMVENNIAYTVPPQFPVCANLKVFAYYSETPYITNQVVIAGKSILPISQSFATDDFTPMTFTLTYTVKPTKEPLVIYDPFVADVVLSGDWNTITVTPKTNNMISILIGQEDDKPTIMFHGNSGTVNDEPFVTVEVDKGTSFTEVASTIKPYLEGHDFLYYSFTKDGSQQVPENYQINNYAIVYAYFDNQPEPPEPPTETHDIDIDGSHVKADSVEFTDEDVEKGNEIEIKYTIDDHFEFDGIDDPQGKFEYRVDEKNSTIYVKPLVKDDIEITINTKVEEITVTFHGNGGTTSSEEEDVVLAVPYNSTLSEVAPIFYDDKDVKQLGYATDAGGKNHISNDYKLTKDNEEIYAYYDTLTIALYTPTTYGKDTILTYGSATISYTSTLKEGTITVTPSVSNIVECTIDNETNCIIVNSIANYQGSVKFTVSNGSISKECQLSIKQPTSQQQASEAVDFALTQGLTQFKLTFNYQNEQDSYDFYNSSLETRLCLTKNPVSKWTKGFGKENEFTAEYNENMGKTKVDISKEHPEFYYNNLTNAAYEMRRATMGKGHKLPIDSVPLTLLVHNSEGLFFALEHGYKPQFDSYAEKKDTLSYNAYTIYQNAREVCSNAYGEGIKEFNQIRQLYDWLVGNTHYDHWIISEGAPTEKNLYSSYYADGVFLNNGIAVCDGFSKAFTILCGIEKLPVVRSAGFATYEIEGETEVSGHAWNYYYSEDKKAWYLICPTWSHIDTPADSDFINYNFSLNSYQPFMRQSRYFYQDSYDYAYSELLPVVKDETVARRLAITYAEPYDFVEGLYGDLNKSTTDYTNNIYALDYGTNYTLDVKDKTSAQKLANAIPDSLSGTNFTVNLPISAKDYLNDFASALTKRSKFTAAKINFYTNNVDNYPNSEYYVAIKCV